VSTKPKLQIARLRRDGLIEKAGTKYRMTSEGYAETAK
jgi:predicted transcriptional regulator